MSDFQIDSEVERRVRVSLLVMDPEGRVSLPTIATLRAALDALEPRVPAGSNYLLNFPQGRYIEAVWTERA